ncbi:MAG: 2-dehydropantoate 2-reductase [Candidatus Eisenbacteria bacterium]|nr:2-dehydropantoate 2-reductase [Candidatus Eisenbacteria bacterium]
MKTVIVGAGAMGSLFGGLLSPSDEEVWLVDIWKEHIDSIRSNGLVIEGKREGRTIPVKATMDVTSFGKADLVLFFVKTYHTEKAVSDSLALEKEDTIFLTLQNGLGNEEMICSLIDRKKVVLGVTGQGATLLGPGHIRHGGMGKTYLGELDGKITDRVAQIARMFNNAGIETEVSSRIHDLVWEKLFVNVGLNALAALLGLKNGQLLDHPETLRIMEALVSEAIEVAKRKSIRIEGSPMERVKTVIEATRENRCSMGQDLDYRRRTEIDAINGAIVREAGRLGISVPYNQMITDLIKVIEKSFHQG